MTHLRFTGFWRSRSGKADVNRISGRTDFVAAGEMVLLRLYRIEDSEKIVEWRNKEELRRWYIYREEFTPEGQLRYFHEQVETGRVFHYMICLKQEPHTPIGCLVFTHYEPERNTIEYGLFIGETALAAKGMGTDAIRAGMRYAFRHFGVSRITCRIITENIPSVKSNEKAGFIPQQLLPGIVCSDGKIVTMQQFVIRPDTVTGRFYSL